MEDLDRKINLWVREHLITQLSEDKYNTEFTTARPSGTFYLSDPFFVTLRSSKSSEKRILVKIPSQNPVISAIINYDELFANETLFYKEIARYNNDYAKCYLAGKDPVFKNIIVLEDLRPRGYFISPSKIDVNLDYVVAGLKAIARFHGHTYAIKEKEPYKFRKYVQSMIDIRFKRDPINEEFKKMINDGIPHVIRTLQLRNYDRESTKKICNLFEDAFTNVMLKCVEPSEPLATIIHGDCTINNLLYRWDKKNTKLEAMLIDFAVLMYSSPAIDVSTFLYMTCKREDIRDRSKDLFEAYHFSLTECVKERGIWNASKYSREIFWHDYRNRAVFGYIVATFFRGKMTEYERGNDILQLDDETLEEFNVRGGGLELSNLLVDMLDDLRDAGMLDEFIGKF